MRAKEIIASNYNLAAMTATFVGANLGGKNIPFIEELYPDQFSEPKKEVDNSWVIYKERMMDYAIAHNKNRKKEGEKP